MRFALLSKAKSRRCAGPLTRSVCSLSQGDPRESGLPNYQRERSLATARRPLPLGLLVAREQAALALTRTGRLCRGPPLRAGPIRCFRAKRPKFVLLSHFQIPETVPPAKVHRVPPGRSAGATLRPPRRSGVKSRVSQRSGLILSRSSTETGRQSSQKPARKKNLVSVLLFQLRFGRAS